MRFGAKERGMTKQALWLAALLAAPAFGQVELRLRLANSTVVHMESILASVTVVNGTTDALDIGETNGNARLFFDIEASPGRIVGRAEAPMFRKLAPVPVAKSATLEFDLLNLYQIRSSGAYSVVARLHSPAGLVTSSRQYLDVVPGMPVTSMSKPGPGGNRFTYQLRSLARDREDHLFLRIDDDAKSLCYGVFDLGSMLRVVDPVMRSDGRGRIHVLHQSAPARFTHSVFEPDGQPVSSQFWTGRPSGVALQLTEDGDIVVAGAQAYRGDKVVAPPSVDSRRVEEMQRETGLQSRFMPGATPSPARDQR